MSEELKDITIERSRWLRGEGDNSFLLREKDGRMCCLGFACVADAIPSERITGMGRPDELFIPPAWAAHPVIETMMRINDDMSLRDRDREAELQEVAVDLGWRLVFVD